MGRVTGNRLTKSARNRFPALPLRGGVVPRGWVTIVGMVASGGALAVLAIAAHIRKTFIREPFRMTNMDSSIFHKEENNESKTMDGGDRCGSHTVCVRNRAAGAMAEEATAPSTPATSTTCATNGNTVTVKGTDADAFKTWNGKTSFEQPHVQSGESRQLQDR